MSRKHANVIREEGDRYAVEDLGSSNGTFVQVIEETELRNGDVLLMGQQLFRIAL
ncbi:MAG: FHA domain-containing protein [Polyangiaceae bacterium]